MSIPVEFAEFLQLHTEAFVVEGDRVRLKNLPQPAEPIVVDEIGQPLNGAKAKEFAVDYLKSLLDGVEAPMPMEQLYRQFCDKFPHSVRQEVGMAFNHTLTRREFMFRWGVVSGEQK